MLKMAEATGIIIWDIKNKTKMVTDRNTKVQSIIKYDLKKIK